jgi:hypothetical protein
MSQADGEAAAARGALLPSMQAVPVFEASPAQEWRGHEKVRELVSFRRRSRVVLQPLRTPRCSGVVLPSAILSATCPTRAEHILHDITLVVGSQSAEPGR